MRILGIEENALTSVKCELFLTGIETQLATHHEECLRPVVVVMHFATRAGRRGRNLHRKTILLKWNEVRDGQPTEVRGWRESFVRFIPPDTQGRLLFRDVGHIRAEYGPDRNLDESRFAARQNFGYCWSDRSARFDMHSRRAEPFGDLHPVTARQVHFVFAAVCHALREANGSPLFIVQHNDDDAAVVAHSRLKLSYVKTNAAITCKDDDWSIGAREGRPHAICFGTGAPAGRMQPRTPDAKARISPESMLPCEVT